MATAIALPPISTEEPSPLVVARENLVVLSGIEWDRYLAIDKIFDGRRGIRLTYLDGDLEIMTLGYDHETIKATVRSILENFILETGQYHRAQGSVTRRQADTSGIEPDESYVLKRGETGPHLAIEVCITSGGIDKLEIYRRFKVPEVWIWQEGELKVFALEAEKYERRDQSLHLPDLDMELVEELSTWAETSDAVAEFKKRQFGE